jgi:hypothetical protein
MQAIKISKKRLKEMKASVKLSDLVRHTCPDLESFGRNKYCICPFHKEKSASLCVNDDLEKFYCFGCGAQGDHVSFVYHLYFSHTLPYNATPDIWPKRAGVDTGCKREKVFMNCVRKLSQITGISIKKAYNR